MRCPKCGFTSFPYLENCGKCGQGLAEQRAALGVYALHPDPPDLRLAYQVLPRDVEVSEDALPQASAGIDLGTLEEINLDLAEADEPLSAPALEAHTLDAEAGQTPAREPNSAPVFDLSELGEIKLELEDPAQLQDTSIDSPQPPMAAPQVRSVYDLDLDTDADELALGPNIEEAEPLEAPQDAIEYVLEIDDEIEVEFEVDELDIEEEDDEREPEEEDDDER